MEPVDLDSVPSPRVASLLPSATEMVCAVGMEEHLVGVSHECDWPPSVVGRPVLTGSRLAPRGRSGEVDRDLRRILAEAVSLYTLDEEALARARPDVLVTQDLCEVCAVSKDDVLAAVRRVLPDVKLVDLSPLCLADVWNDVRRVGEALGRAAEAEAFLATLDARVEAVRARAATLDARPHVLTVEWIEPVMVGGLWMPEMVEIAGGVPLVTAPKEHAPTLTTEQLAALDPAPDVVLAKPCGFPLERTEAELPALARLLLELPWPAVERGAVWLADGNAWFNRPGPRLVESLEVLAACMHPEGFADLGARHAAGLRHVPDLRAAAGAAGPA